MVSIGSQGRTIRERTWLPIPPFKSCARFARTRTDGLLTLSGWRDRFLAAGQTALKSRPGDERDAEIQRLRAKVGEITMDNELLCSKIAAMEGKYPLARRRSRR